MGDQLKQSALDFHELPVPGKTQVSPTKPLVAQCDLALAYLSGVTASYLEIEMDPLEAYKYTTRDNLVAVIFNGTAVLGLGNIDALTSKPVMEGKGVLFKKSVGIDVFDIKVDELDPGGFIGAVTTLEPVFGDISLEDIKVSKCFYIEQKLRERMNIPVFHDDQHGVAIISTAAILSGLRVVEKNIFDVRMMVSGAGAVTIACMNLLVALGLQKHNIVVCDSRGVIYQGREPNMAGTEAVYAVVGDGKRTLDDVIESADVFLDCSGLKVLTQEMVKKMTHAPVILVLASPELEILLLLAKEVRPDATACTGHSDYPDQVNNVLCFPLIFRGALDVDATVINEEMKLAAVHVIAELAHAEQSEAAASVYDDQDLSFGPEYIVPKSFDPRLIVKIAPAVARAAIELDVATRPIADFDVYIDRLTEFVYRTDLFMKLIFSQARKAPKRVVLSEGEEAHVLHATQELVTLGLAKPTFIGRPNVIEMHIQKLGLQIKSGVNFEIVGNEFDPYFKEYQTEYSQVMRRRGVAQERTQHALTSNSTVIGVIMVQRSEADAVACDTVGDYHEYFSVVRNVFGYHDGVCAAGAMNALPLPSGNTSITDTRVNDEPDTEELAEITPMVAETVRRFGIEPRVALLSHSNFGSSDCPSSSKIRQVLELVRKRAPELMIDGGMHGDAVLVEVIRNGRVPDNPSKGSVNIPAMLNMEAARISHNLPRVSSSEGTIIGPVLMGVAKPVHVLTPIVSVYRIVNTVTLAVIEAQTQPL